MPMVNEILIALFATSNHVTFQVEMRAATKTHIVFAGRTNYVVATRFFLNWNTTMATWFGKLPNRLFRLSDLSSGFVFITGATWVCVAKRGKSADSRIRHEFDSLPWT
jgi:formate hydrogenlyase subunit 3/multisubunit Na+/H+ antiporter MnhD subunit